MHDYGDEMDAKRLGAFPISDEATNIYMTHAMGLIATLILVFGFNFGCTGMDMALF